MTALLPQPDCALCPRLSAFREANRVKFPDKHNAPVAPFGPENAELLIVGLAPGLKGANFSGRPFTGDYAGDLLYNTMIKFGFATGIYDARPDDDLILQGCRITNAVKCVPPENKPASAEIKNCQRFLTSELQALPNLKVVLSLGLVSHNAVLKALGCKLSAFKFAHGAVHTPGPFTLVDSYHCSRYNTQTGRLTAEMFETVFRQVEKLLIP